MKNLPPLCYKICENPFKNTNKTCNLRLSVSGGGTGREIRKGTFGFVFCRVEECQPPSCPFIHLPVKQVSPKRNHFVCSANKARPTSSRAHELCYCGQLTPDEQALRLCHLDPVGGNRSRD